jgi:hypothetical protein
MPRVIRAIDGERVIVTVPDPEPEGLVPADPRTGQEAANPPGSFEALYRALTGRIAPIPDEGGAWS